MPKNRGFAVMILAATLVPALTGEALGQGRPDASYQNLIDEGLSEFELGNWSEALALFSEAHETQPSARTLRAVGMTLFELRRYVEAIDYLERSLKDERKPLDAGQRRAVQALLDRAQRFVGTVKVKTRPGDARVMVDGKEEMKREILLDGGEHQFMAEAEGYKPTMMTVAVRPAATQSVSLFLLPIGGRGGGAAAPEEPASEPEPTGEPEPEPADGEEPGPSGNVWPWVLIGTGGALGIGGVITGVMANGDYGTLEDECDGPVCATDLQSTKERGQTLDTVTNVLWVTGGVAIAAGVVLLLVSGGGESEPSDLAWAPACTADGCGMLMHGGF